MATATEPHVSTIIDRLAEAESAIAQADADAARERALKSAAKPATRAELKARADAARTAILARRSLAIESYAQKVNDVYLHTEQVADAHTQLATASEAAFRARRDLAKIRATIEDTFGVATARNRYNEATTPDNRDALFNAQAKANDAMRDLPEIPVPFGHRFASRIPASRPASRPRPSRSSCRCRHDHRQGHPAGVGERPHPCPVPAGRTRRRHHGPPHDHRERRTAHGAGRGCDAGADGDGVVPEPTPIPVTRVEPDVLARVRQAVRIAGEARNEVLAATVAYVHRDRGLSEVEVQAMEALIVCKAVRWEAEMADCCALEDDLRRAAAIQVAVDRLTGP